jgi:hypothetical protein
MMDMEELSLAELKRLFAPFDSGADQLAARRYWSDKSITDKMRANERLAVEVYRWAGVDVDKPMDKTIRFASMDEKNRQHEEAQQLYQRFRESTK